MSQIQTVSQALARKWRPKDFDELVGQEHVVRALSHALASKRLHHAYLLTGTRGVGKTTIARILAKAVNCEQGITAKPCGVCRACTEIAQGRFVDLLEVDAATNTRVDEMRHLLENAAYAPTTGRYKVYVIDEVHMLSNSSFNAMLKTLEEPPGHILFVLATTDPQKIPPTVLSRCLQFGLRQLSPEDLALHLERVLGQESIGFEPGAVRCLAKAARGSVRDALSLTDQAIAFSAGQLQEAAVREMLGAVDQGVVAQILRFIAANDGAGLTELAQNLSTQGLSFGSLLDELANACYRLSVAAVAGGLDSSDPDQAALLELENFFSGEDLQLLYQVATHARSELALAPEEHIGFTMALIRMMCFKPSNSGSVAPVTSENQAASVRTATSAASTVPPIGVPEAKQLSSPKSVSKPVPGVASASAAPPRSPVKTPPGNSAAQAALAAAQAVIAQRTGGQSKPASTVRVQREFASPSASSPSVSCAGEAQDEPEPAGLAQAQPVQTVVTEVESTKPQQPAIPVRSMALPQEGLPGPSDWPGVAVSISAKGVIRQALLQTELVDWTQGEGSLSLQLRTSVKNWTDPALCDKLSGILTTHFGRVVRVGVVLGQVQHTASLNMQAVRKEALVQAHHSINSDPFVQNLQTKMGAKIIDGSVRALHQQGPADV